MISFISQFGLNILMVSAILILHLLTFRILLLIRGRRGDAGRWKAVGIITLFLLDLPLFYLQLIYKSWHPLFVDEILYAIRFPWALLMINSLALGVIIVGHYYGTRIVKRLFRGRKGAAEQSPAHTHPSALTMNKERTTMMKKDDVAGTESGFTRRSFLQTSGLAMGGIILNASLLSAANGDEDSVVERIHIRIPDLPPALSGTTIAMLSDIHSSVFMNRSRMERYAGILNSLKADLIVLPGDFVNSKVREVYPLGEAFSGLEAPLGVYGVTGNHDYYTRKIETIAKEVEQAGIRLLRNENIQLEKNGATFRLMGMDDDAIYDVREYVDKGKTEKGRIENLVKGVGDKEPTIFLCHKPYPFEDYAKMGVDLTLSGHTHGGQIVLGKLDKLNVSVASLASTYIAGLYKARSNPASQMYISRGIGTAGIPIRINCPPEVTHITLV